MKQKKENQRFIQMFMQRITSRYFKKINFDDMCG